MKSADWIGFRQGQLTVVSFDGLDKFSRGRAARFTFRCDCGREFSAQKSNVIGRGKNDCGHSIKKHGTAPRGATSDPLHKVWWHMIDRCVNPNNKSFPDYGGRGIKVCDRWRHGDGAATGFESFLADMGDRPAGRFTIERVQGDKDYAPGNCMWLPKGDQSKNRRGVKLIRIGTRAMTIPDWCKETGISYWTAVRRISRGWSPDRAVTAALTPRARRATERRR